MNIACEQYFAALSMSFTKRSWRDQWRKKKARGTFEMFIPCTVRCSPDRCAWNLLKRHRTEWIDFWIRHDKDFQRRVSLRNSFLRKKSSTNFDSSSISTCSCCSVQWKNERLSWLSKRKMWTNRSENQFMRERLADELRLKSKIKFCWSFCFRSNSKMFQRIYLSDCSASNSSNNIASNRKSSKNSRWTSSIENKAQRQEQVQPWERTEHLIIGFSFSLNWCKENEKIEEKQTKWNLQRSFHIDGSWMNFLKQPMALK